jgi:hypothetical protein
MTVKQGSATILVLLVIIAFALIFALIQINKDTSSNNDFPQGSGDKHFCLPEDRLAEFCIEIYQPVCGWNNTKKIQCIKYPCAQTYSNTCFACKDENVAYYTKGKCPI